MQAFATFIKIMILGNFLSTIEKLINKANYFSEVHLVIRGTGSKKILSDSFNIEPSEVKINGVSNNCKTTCYIQSCLNNVVLYFNFFNRDLRKNVF